MFGILKKHLFTKIRKNHLLIIVYIYLFIFFETMLLQLDGTINLESVFLSHPHMNSVREFND